MIRALPPLTAWSSAITAAIIGFGGTVALVVQAMKLLGANVAQSGSAVTALCIGIALGSAALSWRLKMPVVLAWSTPGAALLAASAISVSWPALISIFVAASVMMILLGLIPALGRLAEHIPPAIASAMLAGVLLPFCLALFSMGASDPLLAALLLVCFVASRQYLPLYAMLIVLVTGLALVMIRGEVTLPSHGPLLGQLLPVLPSFDIRAIISVAVPLFLVTLVSQNLPGLVVLRTAGYQPPAGPLLVATGTTSLAMAPFGAFALNLAAITAAICTNEEAHADRTKRWTVGLIYGGCYGVLALFSPALVQIFLGLPETVIAVLTGIALIPALIGAMQVMLASGPERDPAILTFLATGSGLALWGLGSAFWGLVVGFGAMGIGHLVAQHRARKGGNAA